MKLSILAGTNDMTEEEEAVLQERLKKAQKLSKEIKTLEKLSSPDTSISVILYMGHKKGGSMTPVNMPKELREEIESTVLISLEARLIDLREEYSKL